MSPFAPITVSAPCRIDLAGGTLDLYPLYLFEDGGLTVNAAVDIMSTATVEPRDDEQVVLRSLDLALEAAYPNLEHVAVDGPLGLVGRAVKCYGPRSGMTVTVHNEAPHGSGLGASSALLMALSVALTHLDSIDRSYTELIDVGANLEAQTIGIPTGKQDYYPALYGGVSALRFGVRGHGREVLCESPDAWRYLEERLILSFTGISHFSGASNWEMLRNYVDGNMLTREAMGRIGRTAEAMYTCLRDGELERLPLLVAEEWANRRSLAEGVSTPTVERMIQAAAAAGAQASKLCGAGGGGCMVTVAEPQDRPAVEAALRKAGADLLPFRLATTGAALQEVAAP